VSGNPQAHERAPCDRSRHHAAPSRLRSVLAAAVALASAGCLGPGTTQPLRYYVLSPVAIDRPVDAERQRMGVMPVRLPGYLDRPALVERRGAEIFPSTAGSWAAPLDEEFARVLAENLQRAHPGYEVAVFPWRRSFAPQRRLDVDVSRFEVENGSAVLHARWRVLGPNGDGAGPAVESRISVPVARDDDQGRVVALSRALGELSAEMGSALSGDGQKREPAGTALGPGT
jgi:uncharacterized lipoprotein YmbA